MCAGMLLGTPSTAQAVDPNVDDLNFILKQFELSNAHPDGNLRDNDPTTVDIIDPQLPDGLRTVTGVYNNLLSGKENFGAADQLFPRMLEPFWRDGDVGSYGQTGDVVDRDPRMISNLIVDMTDNNPAAVAAAASTPGSEKVPGTDLNVIPNRAPDVGLSAPYNAWFTAFGQFFDHGLDLVTKGNAGTVMMPLPSDDPLIAGPDGILDDPSTPEAESTDDLPAGRRFMPLTRASVTVLPGPDGQIGTPDDRREHTNTTSPFVDQNQTYTSHPSHQVFLREYKMLDQKPVSTGRLLDSKALIKGGTEERGGLATWAEIKDQARSLLGIELTDTDVLNVPLLKTDAYGKFVRSTEPATLGYPIVLFPNPDAATDPNAPKFIERSGTPGSPLSLVGAARTGHAFLDDIAHFAVPAGTPDANTTPGSAAGPPPERGTYDNELLDAHFITGDGRGNENIGLTAVHHVFHTEHNLLVEDIERLILAQGPTFAAKWQLSPGEWDGEKLFQAAKFMTEMQYQHLVFEEFARKVQPQVNVFGAYDIDIDPAITAEFAHTVYRFGHSMLREDIPRVDAQGKDISMGLIEGFLNPLAFNRGANGAELNANEAAGAVARGMVGQVGNEIDEFVTDGVRSNLLGLPLDLAAINIARARDTGVASLNQARREFYAATAHPALEPYESWRDFGLGLRHPESLVNFVAAYGTHPTITSATTANTKRAAAQAILDGAVVDGTDFLNSSGAWASKPTGLEDVDFWVGGLAERQMPFGGLLGSTFNFVFETQLEKLQDGDRLYYLTRTAGLNFLTQLEQNSFSELVSRTTGVKHLPADVFSVPDLRFEMANLGESGAILDDPATPYNETELLVRMNDGTVRYPGELHVLMGGTDRVVNQAGQVVNDGVDLMRAGDGDDTVWGDSGDDRIEGDAGNDSLNGGADDDIITDIFGDDNIKGGDGDDAINAGSGIDLILGAGGKDFVVAGSDPKETFGDGADDFIRGGDAVDTVFGDEGHDWIEGGAQEDILNGEHAEPFFDDAVVSHDVMDGNGGLDELHAEGGDDVLVQGSGQDFNEGMLGFDWGTYARYPQPADADLNNTGLVQPARDNLFDFFDLTEALSGWDSDDVLRGSNRNAQRLGDPATQQTGDLLTQESLAVIDGLGAVLAGAPQNAAGQVDLAGINNVLLGGDGLDRIEGRGGNDVIDGDSWLNVRLEAPNPATPDPADRKLVNGMSQLQADVFAGRIDPGQIEIVRTIESLPGGAGQDGDVAEFSGSYHGNTAPAGATENYVITFSGGTATVRHVLLDANGDITGTGPDGIDTVKNVEALLFKGNNTRVDVGPASGNSPAAGTVRIVDNTTGADVTVPKEDQVLKASRFFDGTLPEPTFTDADGVIEPVTYEWQVETNPRVSGPNRWSSFTQGETLTVTDDHVGRRLRVVATFTDGKGVGETVMSAPTGEVAGVNDPATGVLVSPSPLSEVRQELTAHVDQITDADGTQHVSAFGYEWQSSAGGATWQTIAGATSSTFTPSDAYGEKMVRVVVSFTDDRGNSEVVESLPVDVKAVAPDASRIQAATARPRTASVQWLAPERNGGSEITKYVVRLLQAGNPVPGVASVEVVPGPNTPSQPYTATFNNLTLTRGLGYVFEVTALNTVGSSVALSAPVSPTARPGALGSVNARPGVRSARLNWGVPDSGDADLTYRVQVLDGAGNPIGEPHTANTNRFVVEGLTNGQSYGFEVWAVNVDGPGPAVRSSLVTPANLPGVPRIESPSQGRRRGPITATARWSAPRTDGGSPITGYKVVALRVTGPRAGTVVDRVHSPRVDPSRRSYSMELPSGVYRFRVVACNAVGRGLLSSWSQAVEAR